MKHLLKLSALTPKEILHILDVADEYKRLHKQGVDPKDLQRLFATPSAAAAFFGARYVESGSASLQ